MQSPTSAENDNIKLSKTDYENAVRSVYSHVRERDFKRLLPKRWDPSQASAYLELSNHHLTVAFRQNANIQNEKDPSGVVRTDHHIPSCTSAYYFEVRILHGHHGCMGVGLTKRNGDLSRMPGWDAGCYGYHGDDGNFFTSSGTGKAYGPKFGTGDVIGCGIDTVQNTVFFTKNGKHLGIAFQGKTNDVRGLYPTVGLKTPGMKLHLNLGYTPFMFDFDGYRQNLINQKIHKIENIPMPADIGVYMDRVMTSFLGNSGALETLKAFEKVSKHQKPIDHEFLRKRKEIVDMVMNAKTGSSIQQKIEEHFPGCIESDDKVHLLLLCLRYVDLANTMATPPASFRLTNCEPSVVEPIEVRSRPPKLLKGNHCKSTKRTREAHKKGQKSRTPPPVRRTSAKAAEDLCLQNAKIEKFYNDPETKEEMVLIDGLSMTKKMYVEMHISGEFDKVSYMMKMGREIMGLAAKVGTRDLRDQDREILERSLTMVLRPSDTSNRPHPHPLNTGYRRYIANSMVEMINNFVLNPKQKEDEQKPGTSEKTEEKPKENHRIYSELRGMLFNWHALHFEAMAYDIPASGVYFLRKMVLEDLHFKERPIEYSIEPMEISKESSKNGDAVDMGEEPADEIVVMEEDGNVDEEEDV